MNPIKLVPYYWDCRENSRILIVTRCRCKEIGVAKRRIMYVQLTGTLEASKKKLCVVIIVTNVIELLLSECCCSLFC